MAQQNIRAKRQQRQRIIIILILLLVILGGAFYFITSNSAKPNEVNVQRPLGKVAVPVLTRDLPLGVRIASFMIRVNFMYPHEVPPDAILNSKEFLGRFIARPLLAGDYIRVGDVSEAGAHGGYSAIAQPDKRLVVLSSRIFPGAINSLRVGDRVDLLAIADANAGMAGNAGGDNRTRRERSPNTIEGGGTQPGDPNALSRRRRGGAITSPAALTATLIAENAEVMRTPSRGPENEIVVLQMNPQDAHVTTLMAASGATMRVVFRPYNDETRLTQDKEVKVTTRLPKPSADPDAITIISGNVRRLQRPNSQLFLDEAELQNNTQEDEPQNSTYSDVEVRNVR